MFNTSKPSNSYTLYILYQNATFNTSKHMCSHTESYIQTHLHIIIILMHILKKKKYNKTSMPQIRESKKFIRRKKKKKRKEFKCVFIFIVEYIGCDSLLILFITFYVNLIKPLTVPCVCSRPFLYNVRPLFILLIFIACAQNKK